MMETVRVLLVDDHALVRSGLRRLLCDAGIKVVAEAADGEAAIAEALRHDPDVALYDLDMPAGGTEGVAAFRLACPRTRVLVVTGCNDAGRASEARRRGASGYVLKGASPSELLGAIQVVNEGGVHCDHALAPVEHAPPLSARERQVLDMVCAGHTRREIAQSLGVSPKSVDTYRARVHQKLGTQSRAELFRLARAL